MRSCLVVGPTAFGGESLCRALEGTGWQVAVAEHQPGDATSSAHFDLVLLCDAGKVSRVGVATRPDGVLVCGILPGGAPTDLNPSAYDMLFCRERAVTEWMRSIGATACSLPAHPAWSDWCAEVLNRHFHHRVRRYPPVDWSRISSDYAEIVEADVTDAMVTAWQSEQIPERQRALVQWELAEMYAGRAPLVYSALARALRPYVTEGTGVLEIGCASGYYSEVLEYLLDLRIAYAGVDYSDPLIRMARVIYPRKPFYVGDGASLPFRDRQFRVAVSSCVLLHVPNYREHIAETARVAAGVVVAHRTPVTRHRPTQIFRKLAYGVETVELVFNEDELLGTFEESGLRPVSEFDLSADPAEHSRVVTYVFER